jgi:PBP1b-binding outer membrane lipoprotein LpoB
MKARVAHLLLLAALAAMAAFFSGCASTESDNVSPRPWNTSEGWNNGALGGMDTQHR